MANIERYRGWRIELKGQAVACLFLAWALIASLAAGQATRIHLEPAGNQTLRSAAEENASAVLTAINRAMYFGGQPDLSDIPITDRGRDAILSRWARASFLCSEYELTRRLVQTEEGTYEIRSIPLIVDGGTQRDGVLTLNAEGTVVGFRYSDEPPPRTRTEAEPVETEPVEPKTGSITVDSEPSGASVVPSVGGDSTQTAPARFTDVPEGQHAFTIRKEGYREVDTLLTVQAGQSVRHTVRLTPLTGVVTVHSEPSGASVVPSVGGDSSQTAPARFTGVPEGQHAFTIRKEGYRELDTLLTVRADQSMRHTVRLTPAFGYVRIEGAPEQSTVRVDGVERSLSEDGRIRVRVGEHTVTLSGRYYETRDTTLAVAAGQTEVVFGQLRRKRVIHDLTFSPSNRALVAYSRQSEDTRELYLHDTDTEAVRQITAVEEPDTGGVGAAGTSSSSTHRQIRRFEGQLAWRPVLDVDGRQWFVFVSSVRETGRGLYLSHLTPEGTPAGRTVELPFQGQVSTPAWSPDGRQLVFSGRRSGSDGTELFLYPEVHRFLQADDDEVPANGSPVQLTDHPAGNLYPDWSPDGRYIAYQSRHTGSEGRSNWGIRLLDLASWAGPESGTRPSSVELSQQLRSYHEHRPSWSPDGTYIAFYVSQSEIGRSEGSRRWDIGVLKPVRRDGRVQEGRVLSGYTGRRVARNVLPNRNRGPEWYPSDATSSLLYVAEEDGERNPIYLADVTLWSREESGFSQRLSSQFQEAPRRREEVSAALGAEGLRLAFASQVGDRLQLQVREVSTPAMSGSERSLQIPREIRTRTSFFRSSLFPGMGQFYRGQQTRGWVFAVSGGLTLAAAITGTVLYEQYNSDYEDALRHGRAKVPKEDLDSREDLFDAIDGLESAYDKARITYWARNAAIGAFAGVWVLNLLDSLTGPDYVLEPVYAGASVRIERPAVKVTMHGEQPAYGLALRIQF